MEPFANKNAAASEAIRNVDDILRTASVAASTTGAIAGARHPSSKRRDEGPGRRVASDIVLSNTKLINRPARIDRAPSERPSGEASAPFGEGRLTYERLQQYAAAHAVLTAPPRPGPRSIAGSVSLRKRATAMLPFALGAALPHGPQAALPGVALAPSSAVQPPSPGPAAAASPGMRLALTTPGLGPQPNGRPSSARRPASPHALVPRLGAIPLAAPLLSGAPGPGAGLVAPSAAGAAPPPERAFGPRATDFPSRASATSPHARATYSGSIPDPHANPRPQPQPQRPVDLAAKPSPARAVGWQAQAQAQARPLSPASPQPLGLSRGQNAAGSTGPAGREPVGAAKGAQQSGRDSPQAPPPPGGSGPVSPRLQLHGQPPFSPRSGQSRQHTAPHEPAQPPPQPAAPQHPATPQQPHTPYQPQPPHHLPQPHPAQHSPQPHPPPQPLPPPQQQQQPQEPDPAFWQFIRPASPTKRPASAAAPRRVVGLRDLPAGQLLAARAAGGGALSPEPGQGAGGRGLGPNGGGGGPGPKRRSSDGGGTHADWWHGAGDSEASYPMTAITDRHALGGGDDDMTPSEAAMWMERMAALEAEVVEEREFRRKYEEELRRLAAAVGAKPAAGTGGGGGGGGAGGGTGGAGSVAPRTTSRGRVLTGARAAAAAVMAYRPGRPN